MAVEEAKQSVLFKRGFLVLFLGAYLALLAATLSDYGPNWDAPLGELYLGDRYFYFLKSLDPAYLDLAQDNIPIYHRADHPDFFALMKNEAVFGALDEAVMGIWGFGQCLSAATKHVFYTQLGWLDPLDAHQLAPGLAVAVQCLVLYLFAWRYLGPIAAVTAVIALVSFPRYWHDLHNDAKDVIETVFFTLVLTTAYHAVQRRRAWLVVLATVLGGMALATKGNAAFLPLILGPWLLVELVERRRRGESLLTRGSVVALCASPVLVFAVFLVCWPYHLLNFPGSLLELVDYLRLRGGSGPDHWQSTAVINAVVTMPISVMVLAAAGLLAMLLAWWRWPERRGLHVLILLWMVVPILRVSVPGAVDFDVLRHWMEFLPALALLAGIGAEKLHDATVRALGRSSAGPRTYFLLRHHLALATGAVLLWFVPLVRWDVVNHPFQVAFYNDLVGRLPGAQARGLPQATDYWGTSYRTGLRWLNEHAEKDAALVVGVAEHIVFFVQKTRLREDIQLVPLEKIQEALDRRRQGTAVYFMYVTRTDWYMEPKELYQQAPVFEIDVDGAPILQIARL